MCPNLGHATLPSRLRTSDHPVLGVPVLVQELGQLRRLSGPSLSYDTLMSEQGRNNGTAGN